MSLNELTVVPVDLKNGQSGVTYWYAAQNQTIYGKGSDGVPFLAFVYQQGAWFEAKAVLVTKPGLLKELQSVVQ